MIKTYLSDYLLDNKVYNNIGMKQNKKIDLLAPAGNLDALNAAICGGATSVYLGLDKFNARRGADNFNLSNLKQACDYAHLHGVSIYLTFNIIIFENEFKTALECALKAVQCGIDAFIVQDIGMASILTKHIKDVPVHVSTQMNIHDEAGIYFAKDLGAKRITLARELSISQISKICDVASQNNIEIETFAHGALCVCYSGQCLMSSMIGGRSANRGTCAQACRLNYNLIDQNHKINKENSNMNNESMFLLSPKDLCTIDILPELLDAGVNSLKIEGRMKSPDYVYSVVSVYRKAIDKICKDGTKNYNADKKDHKILQEVFSRGFSTAYMHNKRGNEIMSYKRPNNRGVNVGRVDKISKNKLTIKLKESINQGDILEVWTKHGRCTLNVDKNVQIEKNFASWLIKDDLQNYKDIRYNDRVFRVRCQTLAFKSNLLEPKIPINCTVVMQIGKPVEISFTYLNFKTYSTGDICEEAKTKAISCEEVKEHICRCGQTSFVIDKIHVDLDENVGISFSKLHNLRAEGLDKLKHKILQDYTKDITLNNLSKEHFSKKEKKKINKNKEIKICAIVTNPENSHAVKKAGVDSIYVPSVNYKRGGALYSGKKINRKSDAPYVKNCILMQNVIHDESIKDKLDLKFCDNIISVYDSLSNNTNFEVGPHIPVVNTKTINYFIERGVKRIWLSPELSLEQISSIALSYDSVSFGLYVMGPTELMVTKHCHLMSMGECRQDCLNCQRRNSLHYLLDRKLYKFPVFTDNRGYGHIYNSVNMDLCHCVDELILAGIDSFMIDTTFMNYEECAHSVGRLKKALSTKVDKVKNTTTGHLFRAVL